MEYFVPRFVADLPVSDNPNILNITLAKIDARDLPRVMNHWAKFDVLLNNMRTELDIKAVKAYLKDSIRSVCHHDVEKMAFEKYQRRPHVTVHSGAKPGNKYAEKIARAAAFKIGHLVKKNGFSFWYGGGGDGLMGESGNGFADPSLQTFPDQYSVQVSPVQFVLGIRNAVNGMKAVNEGLAENTDAAIVTSNFVFRRHILDTTLTKEDAAVTLVGATGSINEWSDTAVHIKTSLMPGRKLVGVNLKFPRVLKMETSFGAIQVRIPFMHYSYYNGLQEQRRAAVTYGYGVQDEITAMPFKSSPEEALSYIMKTLDAEGNNPHAVYERRIAEAKAYEESTRPANSVIVLVKPKNATHS